MKIKRTLILGKQYIGSKGHIKIGQFLCRLIEKLNTLLRYLEEPI
jgi:hypothetical protein